MREHFPPSPVHRAPPRPTRARLASELWLRAYWRLYLLTAVWVFLVTILVPSAFR